MHKNIQEHLDTFIEKKVLPNIIFHGESGSGKRHLVHNFISKLYNYDKKLIEENVMVKNCIFDQGIDFIRNDFKIFSKSIGSQYVKIIILYNADKLTYDAQSAMRRIIECYNHTTRIFCIVNHLQNILTPILSRFYCLYIPNYTTEYSLINLWHNNYTFGLNNEQYLHLSNQLKRMPKKCNIDKILILSNNLYYKGYSANNIVEYFKNDSNMISLLFLYNVIKYELHNELCLIQLVLIMYSLRSKKDLENIFIM